ncbi:MAG: HAMP domain-containing histidine kinase, partial [Raineya sp.]|nr:HAMP domain-containing histidine kinase [Raineya sp.]
IWGKMQVGSNTDIQPRIEKIKVKDFLEPIIKFYTPKAQNKNIDLSFELEQCPDYIYSDPFLFGSIIRNLVSNAIKFTPLGGKVKCDITNEQGYLKIVVQDNGIGMSEEVQRSFWTGENVVSRIGTNNEKGTGSALQLLRTFTYLLGGKIYLQSKENEGTTFIVTLPLNKNP